LIQRIKKDILRHRPGRFKKICCLFSRALGLSYCTPGSTCKKKAPHLGKPAALWVVTAAMGLGIKFNNYNISGMKHYVLNFKVIRLARLLFFVWGTRV